MRVSLVIPPSGFLLDDKVFMSLGVLKVAAVLEQAAVPVEVLDLSGVSDPVAAVREHVSTRPSDCYGFTATTPQLPFAVAMAEVARAAGAKTVLGGPHVTLVNAAAKGEARRGVTSRATTALARLRETADVLVAGDGERTIGPALEAQAGTLIDADDPKSPYFLDQDALDASPLPARHLIDVDSYHFQIDGRRALSVIAQLGCPFNCGFCGGRLSPTFRHIRTRSSEHVCAELEHLYRAYGVTAFMFLDDEVNVSTQTIPMLDAIAALQDRLGVRFALRGHVKSQLLTDAQANALVRAGFTSIMVGFESGDPRILANIEKRATREENSRCMAIARRHGLQVKALMSVGHPGETAQTIGATREWLLEERPDDFGLSVITTYPGTPYYDQAMETDPGVWTYTARNGDRLHAVDVDFRREQAYFKGTPGSYRSFVHTDALTAEAIVRMRDEVENSVRAELQLPHPMLWASQIEQSMGQTELHG